jgi:hypothetical protein
LFCSSYDDCGDDDDTSWKLRRAAIKVVSAYVRAKKDLVRHDVLQEVCCCFRRTQVLNNAHIVSHALTHNRLDRCLGIEYQAAHTVRACFRERVEVVHVEILSCFCDMIKQVILQQADGM